MKTNCYHHVPGVLPPEKKIIVFLRDRGLGRTCKLQEQDVTNLKAGVDLMKGLSVTLVWY